MNRQMLQEILNRADTDQMLFGWEDVAEWPTGVLDSLRAVRLLRVASPASVMDCSDCERECLAAPVVVVPRPNGIQQAYLECPEHVRVEKPIECLSRWQVDVDGLAARLAGGLGGTAEELMPGRLWMVGRPEIGGVRTEAFFARGLGWPDGERVLREAKSRKRSQSAVVLVPALARVDSASSDSLEILSLDDVLLLDGDVLSMDVSAISGAVSCRKPNVPLDDEAFRASDDYRCVWRNGEELKPLSPMQAEVIRILDESRRAGSPIMTTGAILAKMQSPPTRLSDIFRGSDPRRVLLKRVGKDTYQLDII